MYFARTFNRRKTNPLNPFKKSVDSAQSINLDVLEDLIEQVVIESFIKAVFETELGKNSLLDIRVSSYPNEYIVAVTLKKETPEALSIAQQLRKIFIDNNLPVAIYTKEAQAEATD